MCDFMVALTHIIKAGGISVIRETSKNLIQYLNQFNNRSVMQVSQDLAISKKRLWYELGLLNDGLNELGVTLINLNQSVIEVPSDFSHNVLQLKKLISHKELIPASHRSYAIAVFVYMKQEWVSLSHLESLLNLSKNSVLNELKLVRELASEYNVELINTRKEGYYFSGQEEMIRKFCEFSMSQLSSVDYGLSIVKEMFAMWDLDYSREAIVEAVESYSKAYDVSFVPERFDDFINILMLLIVSRSHETIYYDEDTIRYIENQALYDLGTKINDALGIIEPLENVFTTVRLLGALQGSQYLSSDENLVRISKEIVARVRALTMASFTSIDTQTLEKNLYEHLVPCYFRVKFDIPTVNPFTTMIKDQYLDLFILIKRCLEPFESYVGKRLTDDELSYFTIHFGGQLRSDKPKRQDLNVVTVCPNGISSSLILNSQLKTVFPMFNFLGTYTTKELEHLESESYDLIFTTVPINTLKPYFVVRPIMNDVEKDILRRQVKLAFNLDDTNTSVDISKIIKAVRKHANITDELALYDELYELVYKNKVKKEGINLDELLTHQMIQYTQETLDWKEGIRLAAQPLLKNGFIEERYIDAMIAKVVEIGPYIVIAPKVAIPHARPEEGALKMGISLLHSEKPIQFDFEDEDTNVNLVFVLSGVDNTSHLTALQQLASLLEEEEDIAYMVGEKDINKLYQFIQEKVEGMEV